MRRLFSVFLFSVILCLSVPVSAQNSAAIRSQVANQQNTIDSLRHVLRGIEKNMEENRRHQFEDSERIREDARQDYGFYVQHVSWVMGLFGVCITLLVGFVGFLVPFMYNKMLRNDLKKCRKQAISAAWQVRQASIRMSGLEKQIVVLQDQLEEMKSIRDTVEKIQKKIVRSEKATQEAAQQASIRMSELEKQIVVLQDQLEEMKSIRETVEKIQEKIEISEKATYVAARKAEISKLFAEAYNERDSKKQIELYTKLINLDPNLAAAYFNRGYVYDEIGEYGKALDDINKSIGLNSNDADAYCIRGIIYKHLGDDHSALKNYNKAIELDSKHVDAYCNRGYIYDDIGEYEKALYDLNMAIELDPNHATSFNNRATVFLHKHKIEQAMADIQKAIELEENADQYDTRGCIYWEKKEYESAIRDFTKAIELNPKEKEFYENRARAYRELAGIATEEEKKQTYRKAEEADRAMVRKLSEDEVA